MDKDISKQSADQLIQDAQLGLEEAVSGSGVEV